MGKGQPTLSSVSDSRRNLAVDENAKVRTTFSAKSQTRMDKVKTAWKQQKKKKNRIKKAHGTKTLITRFSHAKIASHYYSYLLPRQAGK
jgi:hypothetical protein